VALLAAAVLASACGGEALFTKHDPAAFDALVPAGAEIRLLAGGMLFVEGPVWFEEGFLVLSDIEGNELKRWSPSEGLSTYRVSDGPNGNTLDAEGRLLTCEMFGRRLVRQTPGREVETLAERHDGKRLNSPNDVVVHPDGSIWFTDPPYGLRGQRQEQAGNHVFRLDPATGATTVVASLDRPNGLCFSPDLATLYVSDSGDQPVVLAYPVRADGTLGAGAVFAGLAAPPDGMRCDADGRLWCTAEDGVHVFRADGGRVGTIRFPEAPRNLCFGGAEGRTLFVTAGTSLYALDVLVGAP
jgi:gluconolactonase